MRTIRRGDRGAAVAEIRTVLRILELLSASTAARDAEGEPEFDGQTELAIRAFQQSRGLSVDGRVGAETWRALDAARWRLGARTPYPSRSDPLVGGAVPPPQARVLEMGYGVGRAHAIYAARS